MSLKIGILASGKLGKIALDKCLDLSDVNIQFVFTDKKSKEIATECNKRNIDCYVGNPRKGINTVITFLENKSIDVLFSVNYLFIVGEEILSRPKLYAINIHGSLLPKYRGRTPHVWSIINGENETGITAHLMDLECDSGAIVKQQRVPITYQDTGSSILQKFERRYPEIISEIVNNILQNKLITIPQDSSKATYFGRRTPEDGEINWHWQKERINNWVRAQSFPYPGAFTWYENRKVIIDKISFCDHGYSWNEPNGKIIALMDDDPLVKTPNGVIRLDVIRNTAVKFSIGKQFN